MKNPLHKRFIRELKDDLGKYLVIFILLVVSIGFVSGFEVADGSLLKAYHASFEKYNVEDGNFTTERTITASQKTILEKNGIQIFNLNNYENAFTNDTTIRIFAQRDKVDRVCLMKGEMPQGTGTIAIDRMYADNNSLSIGDTLEDADGNVYTISGLVALSDYSALFQDNAELMFDAVKFGVGIVSEEQFQTYDANVLRKTYAWKYDDASIAGSDKEEDVSKDLQSTLREVISIEEFIPRYQNQAITFTGDDMGGDGAMMVVFLDIVIVIVAFVFAVTTRDTIQKEANVIGTLRASGFTVNELVRHYMVMPILVTLLSALIGNILGYTWLKDVCAAMYYGSYSLPTYETIWNADAFIQTTLIPCLIMTFVTWIVLWRSLSLSPLKFLRNDLSRKKHHHSFPLSHRFPIFTKFRLRINFQNIPNYIILFLGIMFGNTMLMFGLALPDILQSYQANIEKNLLANYQTVLSIPSEAMDENHRFQSMMQLMKFSKAVETTNESAEKFSAYTLHTIGSDACKSDEVMIYGVMDDSKYVRLPGNGIYISSLYADKYDTKKGDTITLVDEENNKNYDLTIDGILPYEGSISVFMPMQQLNEMFDLSEDFFAGYFSDTEITDIDHTYIGSVIDLDSLTKVSRQLTVSMGSMMYLIDGFCVGLFVVLMYLLSKIIIEKNAQSISMTKILGYNNKEIGRLYIRSMTFAVIVCIALSLPICSAVLVRVYRIMLKQMMTGWIMFTIHPMIYVEMAVLGFMSYVVVSILEMKKIRNIPMDQALKNVE